MTVVDGEKLENFYPSRDGTNFKLKEFISQPLLPGLSFVYQTGFCFELE